MKKLIVPKLYHLAYKETSRLRVMLVLFKYPEKEFSLSDLAREAGVAKTNIGQILDELHKLNFIEIVKLSNIWRIKANQKNWLFIRTKISYNLGLIYGGNLVDFLNEKYLNPKAIILFGSYRRGEDISTSDIDIAVETDDIKEYKTERLQELEDFENAIGRKIQMHLFNRKTVDKHLFGNIANGIVLLGFLEAKP